MYNKFLNYFENNCCFGNLFMRRYNWLWYIILFIIIVMSLFFYNLFTYDKFFIITLAVTGIALGILTALYFKLMSEEIKKELKCDKVYIDFSSLLKKEKFNSVCFEFQCEKMKKYCIENRIIQKDLSKFMTYVDEDLEMKYPKDKHSETFLSVVVPAVISIATVYTTNNKISNIYDIVGNTIYILIISGIIYYVIYFVKRINFFIDSRSNLLELKEVLRNIDLNSVKKKKRKCKSK